MLFACIVFSSLTIDCACGSVVVMSEWCILCTDGMDAARSEQTSGPEDSAGRVGKGQLGSIAGERRGRVC